MFDKNALVELIKEHSLEFGDFTLASGKKASFYLDCRKVTLHPKGANLIGEGVLEVLADNMPQTVGGMAIGADPITASTVTLAGQRGLDVRGFIVRKEAKSHGKGRRVEGPFNEGESAVILEDTVTTGGSSLQAIEFAEAAGLKVQAIVAVVDRLEGAAEAFAAANRQFHALLTVEDLGVERAT